MSPSPTALLEALRHHPSASALCTRVSQVVLAAAERRSVPALHGAEVSELPVAVELDRAEAETPWGNLLTILDHGAQTQTEWALLSAAVALYVGSTWQALPAEPSLEQLCWLAEHTPCNPWLFIDACLTEPASSDFWPAATRFLVAQPAARQWPVVAGMSAATSSGARHLKRELLAATSNPALAWLLESASPLAPLVGELQRPPPRPWVLIAQAISGWLLLSALGRVIARYLLGARRSASLDVDARGLRIVQSKRLLGRQLADQQQWIALQDIQCVTRETRFAGLGLYLGLLCLAVGSYWGVGLVVSGLRVPGGSPSSIGVGLALIAAGVALDLALNGLLGKRRGQTRVLITTRKGSRLALGPIGVQEADTWLAELGNLRAFRT